MADPGEVVGAIKGGDSEKDPPTFEIVPTYKRDRSACEHTRYLLDEKWRTIKCRDCGEPVDAFSILVRRAEWEREWEHRAKGFEEYRRKMLIEACRRLARLRDTQDSEVEELKSAIERTHYYPEDGQWGITTDDLALIVRKIEKLVGERKAEKRQAKRDKENASNLSYQLDKKRVTKVIG